MPAPAPAPIGTVAARISLGGVATAIAVGEGAVWVREGTTIQRIDPATNAVSASVAVGEGAAVAAGEGAVWAANTATASISRIDPRTNAVAATVSLRGTNPNAVATGLGAVWVGVTNPEGVPSALNRIDPATNSVVAVIADAPSDIGVGVGVRAGAVWTGGVPAVTRIDPATNQVVARIDSRRLGDVAVDTDAVWATSGLDPAGGTGLVRIDPATNAVVSRIEISADGPTHGVDVGFGAVWVTTTRRPARQTPYVVARIDPRTNRVVGRLPLTQTGDVAIGFGAVWVAAGSTLLRIEPAA